MMSLLSSLMSLFQGSNVLCGHRRVAVLADSLARHSGSSLPVFSVLHLGQASFSTSRKACAKYLSGQFLQEIFAL